jgi:uncharacterized membrane protein
MIQTVFNYIIITLEVVGVAIIIFGIIKMAYTILACFVKRIKLHSLLTEIRIELSNYLILSLEVFIGRDIIETLLDPSINDIIILVVLVVLRTLLAFFLNYEVQHIQKPGLHRVFNGKK